MKNTSMSRRLLRTGVVFTVVSLGLGSYSASLQAQSIPYVPGSTELQKTIADAIYRVCPVLVGLAPGLPVPFKPDPNGSPPEKLAYSCSTMVSTAFFLANGETPFPDFNLKITDEEARNLFQAAGPVQMNAQKQVTTTASKLNLLAARLFDLRGGARGFSISMNGVDAPTAGSLAGHGDTLSGATGGAASSDPTFGGRLGGFVKAAGNWGKVDQTTLQDAYEYDAFSILAGVDYRMSDAWILGGALSYEDTRSKFDNSLGHVDGTTWSVAGYGTYTMGPWYVDGFVSYGHVDYDTTRTIFIPSNNPTAPSLTGNATASPNGDQWSLAVGTGYNYAMSGYTLIPFARLGYIHVKNKGFREDEPVTGLGLSVGDRTLESLQSALGATISTTLNTASGVFTPYFTAQWVHEFKNDNPSISAKFVNDPQGVQFFIPTANPTRDYGVFIVGSGATFANGLSGFLQFGAAAGLRDQSNYSVVVGLRKEF